MANTPSAQKMVRKLERRTAVNKARRSRVRTYIKKVEQAVEAGDRDDAVAALRTAES
ncbi:MAG: 30S ribosomal protein S20, partial [Parvularcula sp.]|nr:30S ribosomal protein S20 [Parvularcula sp.]